MTSVSLKSEHPDDNTIPGYTGYIPGGKHFFGERYAVLIKRARMEQKNSLQWNACKLNRQQRTQKYDMESIRSRQIPTIPLKPIAEKTPMYYPKVTQHSVSPYTLRNDHPGKHFIAGYTGFVPRARQFMGMRYPVVTRKALCEFSHEMKELISYRDKPFDLNRKIGREMETVEIYHPETGMVPQYTGHIQGAKYIFGKRFGDSTKEAIRRSKEGCKTT